MDEVMKSLLKQKLHNDYMLVEFDKMERDVYEIRRELLKELILEVEVEEGYEKQ